MRPPSDEGRPGVGAGRQQAAEIGEAGLGQVVALRRQEVGGHGLGPVGDRGERHHPQDRAAVLVCLGDGAASGLVALHGETADRESLGLVDRADRADEAARQVAEGIDAGACLRELLLQPRLEGEAEVAAPRWAEDPTLLFATLQIYLRQAASGAPRAANPVQMAERQRKAREAALALVSERLPLPARTAVRHLLALVQRFMRLRERLRSHVTAVLGLYRHVALDTSRRIESVEPAAGSDAAFYLTLDEIDAFLRDGNESVAERVQRRRRRVERDRALPDPPDTFVGYPPPVSIEAPDTDTLVGLSACAGDVTGLVRVLESPADAADFQAGEILVSACADVGWSPLFLVASAVVTDLGGPLSHAAIVLREYGVPSVVNVKSGTRQLRTGDRVRVDGGAGRVHILERAPRG